VLITSLWCATCVVLSFAAHASAQVSDDDQHLGGVWWGCQGARQHPAGPIGASAQHGWGETSQESAQHESNQGRLAAAPSATVVSRQHQGACQQPGPSRQRQGALQQRAGHIGASAERG
jgi:hypothetical protein